jgi:hypothetical protein
MRSLFSERHRREVEELIQRRLSNVFLQCSDSSVHDIRATVHGLLLETNDSLRSDPSLCCTSGHAAWDGYLAIFALSTKHRAMLSVEDRAVEGSEAERDRAEERQVRRESHVQAEMDTSSADGEAKPAESTAHMGSAFGPDWRSFLEYLKPNEYEAKRKHFFVQQTDAAAAAPAK